MASDQLVDAKAILAAQHELARRGISTILSQLEATEPDLASYLMEQGSILFQQLTALGGPPKRTQRVYRQMESLTLICLLSLRQGQLQLWNQESPENPENPENTSEHPTPDSDSQ